MKKKITAGILSATVLILCLGCQTYQLGASFEPRENSNAIGGVFSGDAGGPYIENSISYIHKPYPETTGLDAHGIGYDFNIKYPFHLANNYISLFPIVGLESRFIFNVSEPAEGVPLPPPEKNNYFGFGVKFGAGFDISFTPAFYLRGTAFYQPEVTTFLNSYPGLRFNAALGYRTDESDIRDRIERGNSERAAKKREQDKQKQEKEEKQNEERAKEQTLQKAITDDPNNARPLYDQGWYRYSNNKNVTAAESWEKALKLDPNYRVKDERVWSVSTASEYGVATSGNIRINDFSLQMQLAYAYYDAATKSGTSPDSVVAAKDKNAALEKALALFRSGYNIDITGGKNNSKNLKTVYLGTIAKTLDLLGRKDEAIAAYIELYRHTEITDALYARIAAALNIPSYYVSAKGNNANDGLSETKPLRSLALAYEKARAGEIKRITVIGRLDYQSEESKNDTFVFALGNEKNDSEILITGKRGVSGSDRAILSGVGSKKSVLKVELSIARFEYIEISGGELDAAGKEGNGIQISISATGIIGVGAVIKANKGAGVDIFYGTCTLSGGEISNNEGGGVNNTGTFTMKEGSIKNNKNTKDGGGVNIFLGNTFIMSGGTISGNSTTKDGGGVFSRGTFTMTGGTISGNRAAEDGGGVCTGLTLLAEENVFTMSGGAISGNTATGYGGGVYVSGVKEEFAEQIKSGNFKQSGGSITNNSAKIGGGVFVGGLNGRYDKTGGTVSGNKTTHVLRNALPGSDDNNITRQQGSLGSGS